jgi:hypothetical protein
MSRVYFLKVQIFRTLEVSFRCCTIIRLSKEKHFCTTEGCNFNSQSKEKGRECVLVSEFWLPSQKTDLTIKGVPSKKTSTKSWKKFNFLSSFFLMLYLLLKILNYIIKYVIKVWNSFLFWWKLFNFFLAYFLM